MKLDTFLREYRNYLVNLELITDYYPERLSSHTLYVIDRATIYSLENLSSNLAFLEENSESVKGKLTNLYQNISKKLDRLVDIAEGYQRLNTNELIKSPIHNLKIYPLKEKEYYDSLLEGIALPRNSVLRNYKTIDVNKSNLNAVETFKMPSNKTEVIGNLSLIDEDNTILKRVVCISKEGDELLSTTKRVFEIPVGTHLIKVITDNVDKDKPNYSVLDILSSKYNSFIRTDLEEIPLVKEGKLLKLVIERDVPSNCYITGKLSLRYGEEVEHVYFNVGNGKKILTEVKDARGDVLTNTDLEDLVLGDEYSTNPKIIEYKGNGVFDISRLNSKDFVIGVSFSLYSFNTNTTPLIKSVYAYTTEG